AKMIGLKTAPPASKVQRELSEEKAEALEKVREVEEREQRRNAAIDTVRAGHAAIYGSGHPGEPRPVMRDIRDMEIDLARRKLLLANFQQHFATWTIEIGRGIRMETVIDSFAAENQRLEYSIELMENWLRDKKASVQESLDRLAVICAEHGIE